MNVLLRTATWLPILLLVLATGACDPVAPTEALPSSERAKVGDGVAEAARSVEGARIVVALHPPAALRVRNLRAVRSEPGSVEPGPYIANLRREVGQLTDAVLARVGTEGLDGLRRFQTVPALGATVRSDAALARLAADPAVARIDLDVGGTGGLATSVPQIGADRRHDEGNRGAGVRVGIMDTGVDADHPGLVGRVVYQACFGSGPNGGFCPDGSGAQTGPGAAEDDAGHGTHVAGIAAASGAGGGSPGVAPEADIVAIKVMDNCSLAGCFYSVLDLVDAWDHIAVNFETVPVRVLNMSLGTGALFGGVCDDVASWAMASSAAVQTLWDLGVVIFASSMNDRSTTSMALPACLEKVVSVAAVDSENLMASFSNANLATDLAAPGVQISSLALGGGFRLLSGTSMAAPHAAGCATLLLEENPDVTTRQIVTFVRDGSALVTDSRSGLRFPLLDCSPDPGNPDPEDVISIPRP